MRLLPWLPVPIAVAVLAVLRPGLLLDGAASPKGLLVMAGVGAAGLLVLAALWRRSSSLALWTSGAVVLALMAATLWPAFRERTVVEAFPPVALSGSAVPAASPSVAPSSGPVSTPAVTRSAAPAPVTAVRLAAGRFHGINHQASGGATLYVIAGRTALRFEAIRFQGTPSPSVHLVRRGARSPGGGIRLGSLKGERGSFSYTAPAGFEVAKGWSVLVWCDTYDVPIAAADLR